ncbi:hypothetical protein [Streptomyces sp. V3I7]|uniref:hypothetical protein n=1 Tax=Streptomyces sp. V3I7 TaxID=3042278 RepID=UPI00277DAADE|nr:hypothetical protein [Streptomyces sp. V3I7]MDQ0993371.1 hypothetical protein [Streptomyces sp. V3I7]
MPFPLPSRTPSGLRRRTLFVWAASVALLAGCSTDPATGGAGRGPSALARARARAARDSRGLVERYDAVIAAHPDLTERLTPLRAEVVSHAEAFGDDGGKASASPSPSASASASSSPSPAVPAGKKDALAGLAAAERTLADRRTADLLDVPGELARLLASVAAAGAAHAYLLTEGGK